MQKCCKVVMPSDGKDQQIPSFYIRYLSCSATNDFISVLNPVFCSECSVEALFNNSRAVLYQVVLLRALGLEVG